MQEQIVHEEKRIGLFGRIMLGAAWGALDAAIIAAKNIVLKQSLQLARRIGKDLTDILASSEANKALAVEVYFAENWRSLSVETIKLLISIFETYVPNFFKFKQAIILALKGVIQQLE